MLLVPYFENKKLEGPNMIAQVEETMLNLKSKLHSGRAPEKKN